MTTIERNKRHDGGMTIPLSPGSSACARIPPLRDSPDILPLPSSQSDCDELFWPRHDIMLCISLDPTTVVPAWTLLCQCVHFCGTIWQAMSDARDPLVSTRESQRTQSAGKVGGGKGGGSGDSAGGPVSSCPKYSGSTAPNMDIPMTA